MKTSRWSGWNALAGLVLVLGLAACRSPQPGDGGGLVAVSVSGRTPAEIQAVTRDVLREAGYTEQPGYLNKMFFEKYGSAMKNVMYGDWSVSGVLVRLEMNLVEVSPGTHTLSCDAFHLRNAGDTFFEDAQKTARLHQHVYRALLSDIKRKAEAAKP